MAAWEALVFMGIGALITGLTVIFTLPGDGTESSTLPRTARCVLESAPGHHVEGVITFYQRSKAHPIRITGTITGLSEGKHGFHLHAYGQPGGNCDNTGLHYNPHGFPHAAPHDRRRHIGDFGNVISVADGGGTSTTRVDIIDSVAKLWGEYSIAGRSMVIHDREDLLQADSVTGPKVACCNIFFVESDSVI